jgi:sugar lactone lactonase YvrE
LTDYQPTVVAGDWTFLESPRWHEGQLWMSDVPRGEVITVSPGGESRRVAQIGDRASGLGFLPDGSVLVTSVMNRQIIGIPELALYADLADLTAGGINDMLVCSDGRCYVGSFGYDPFAGEPPAAANIVLVDRDRSARVVASGIGFPNGMALTERPSLLVAATHEKCILEFDLDDSGSLGPRRVWAEVPGEPDGIAMDAEGAAWVALSQRGEFARVAQGGALLDVVPAPDGWHAIACAFGDDDLRTLYMTTARFGPDRQAAWQAARVRVPGAAS